MINPNCPCVNKECPAHGDCKTCRALHKKRKTYCQSSATQKAFMKFASNVYVFKKLYNAMVSFQIRHSKKLKE